MDPVVHEFLPAPFRNGRTRLRFPRTAAGPGIIDMPNFGSGDPTRFQTIGLGHADIARRADEPVGLAREGRRHLRSCSRDWQRSEQTSRTISSISYGRIRTRSAPTIVRCSRVRCCSPMSFAVPATRLK